MTLLYKFLNFVVRSQILISLGGAIYYLTGYFLLNGSSTNLSSRFIIIMMGTWITYASFRGILNIEKRPVITISVYGGVLIAFIIFFQIIELIFLFHLAILSFLYEPNSFIKTRIFSLRKVPLLKLIILSYIWASLSSYYPALVLNIDLIDRKVSTVFWIQFCFILAITIPFDIRDFYTDMKDNLYTMPRIFGFKSTKYVATFFLVIFTVLVYNYHDQFYQVFILSLSAVILIWKADSKRPDIYYGLMLDGLIMLYFGIVWWHYNYF